MNFVTSEELVKSYVNVTNIFDLEGSPDAIPQHATTFIWTFIIFLGLYFLIYKCLESVLPEWYANLDKERRM